MKLEVTWDNGDKQFINELRSEDRIIELTKDGRIFRSQVSFKDACIDFSKARLIRIIED